MDVKTLKGETKEQPRGIYTSPAKKGSFGFDKLTLSQRVGHKGVATEYEYLHDPAALHEANKLAEREAERKARVTEKPFKPAAPPKKGGPAVAANVQMQWGGARLQSRLHTHTSTHPHIAQVGLVFPTPPSARGRAWLANGSTCPTRLRQLGETVPSQTRLIVQRLRHSSPAMPWPTAAWRRSPTSMTPKSPNSSEYA